MSKTNKLMSKNDFMDIIKTMKKDAPTKAPQAGAKVDWNKILLEMQKLGRPAGLKEIQETLVKDVVVRRRTKNKMEEIYIECLRDMTKRPWVTRVYEHGAYFYWAPTTETVEMVQNALKKSGSIKAQLAALRENGS